MVSFILTVVMLTVGLLLLLFSDKLIQEDRPRKGFICRPGKDYFWSGVIFCAIGLIFGIIACVLFVVSPENDRWELNLIASFLFCFGTVYFYPVFAYKITVREKEIERKWLFVKKTIAWDDITMVTVRRGLTLIKFLPSRYGSDAFRFKEILTIYTKKGKAIKLNEGYIDYQEFRKKLKRVLRDRNLPFFENV